jgi:chromatin remodeling complex protein RSC6
MAKKSSPKKTEKPDSPKRPAPSAFTKKFKLSADLSAIVGLKEASRGETIKELWAYLKKNNLQDPEAKQFFTPDKKMAKIFGKDKLKGFSMAKFLNPHYKEMSA